MPTIYKLDISKIQHVAGVNVKVTAQNAHEHIIKYQEKLRKDGFSKAKPFENKLGPTTIGQYSVVVYATKSNNQPHPWEQLFNQQIEGIDIKYPNLAAFFSVKKDCYAISAGQGQTLFDMFLDTKFPLDAARHIMKPQLTGTERREVAGAIYGQLQQYRTEQSIVSSQNLGTVWRTLKGKISDEVKARGDFKKIFEPDKRDISVVAGSSLSIGRSVDVGNLVAFMDWLVKVLKEKLTDKQNEDFAFLNGLTEVGTRSGKSLIVELKKKLAETIFEAIKKDEDIDFDFSHKNFAPYQEGMRFAFDQKSLQAFDSTIPPSATDVLYAMKTAGEFDKCQDTTDVLKILEHVVFVSHHHDSIQSTRANVLNHLHGEIEYGGKCYFLIDGTWYVASTDFLGEVKKDFKKLLSSNYFTKEAGLKLTKYLKSHKGEGKYNESYLSSKNWLVTDRVFMGNVEISDLIHWDDTNIYIIHNKHEFGVTVRDVASQILHSMNIINQVKNGGDPNLLGEYYDRIVTRYYSSSKPPIGKQAFIDKFNQTDPADIVYVMGYIREKPVDGSTRSNIAKFEAVKLCNTDVKPFDFRFKIHHIEKS